MFAETLSYIVVLAEVQLVGAEEVSSIFYERKFLDGNQVFLLGYFYSFSQ